MAGTSATHGVGEDQSDLSEINVTPLVDVVLVLLMFMLVTPAILMATKTNVDLTESTSIPPSADRAGCRSH